MQPNISGTLPPTTIFSQEQKKETGKGNSSMGQQDFLNLLVEQLKNQDPLSPMENSEFMSQTTAFSQLDEMMNMNKAMQSMLEMMGQQSTNNNGLLNGSNFLGKQIEFTTNTVTVGEGLSNISFYMAETPAVGKSEIRVYNANKELVTVIKPESLKKGENVISWDGKGIGGTQVADGTYSFEVTAYNAKNEKVEVEEFAKGIVKGVKNVNGVLYFDIGSGVVSSEFVYAVTEAPKVEVPKDPDKETEKEPDKDADKKAAMARLSRT